MRHEGPGVSPKSLNLFKYILTSTAGIKPHCWRTIAYSCLILVALVLHPSKNIVHITAYRSHIKLPTEIVAGEIVNITLRTPLKSLQLGSKKMVKVLGLKKYWASVSLYSGSTVELTGEYFVKKPSFLESFFKHSRQKIFKHVILVKRPPLNSGNDLRIPANTWNKMNNKFTAQKLKQKKTMSNLLSKNNGHISNYCFSPPLLSKIVSKFSAPRNLPNGRSYYHTGVDMRASSGTAIRSMGVGHVVFASNMIVPGNIIVVNHGGGLYSRYMHLSRFNVKVSDYVQPGQIIGFSGATGRVEGPHLHWEVLWKSAHLNPHNFIKSLSHLCPQKNMARL